MTIRLMTRNQVAEAFSVSLRTLDTWRSSGRFPKPVLTPGGKPRWREADIERWLAKRKFKRAT